MTTSNKNKGYKIDFTAKTITLTKAFSELAQDPESKAFGLYIKLKRDLPDFKFVTPSPKPRKRSKKITYDKMVKYISCQKDSIILLKRFTEIRELSKSDTSPYNFVFNWFSTTFPSYGEMPKFDEEGKIIQEYILTADGTKTTSETDKSEADTTTADIKVEAAAA